MTCLLLLVRTCILYTRVQQLVDLMSGCILYVRTVRGTCTSGRARRTVFSGTSR
jgi:hypothetical protein